MFKGSSAAMLKATNWKSHMGDLFAAANVPHVPHVLLRRAEDLADASALAALKSLGFPLFMKIDDGTNSQGLSIDTSIARSHEALMRNARAFLADGGRPIVVQRMLSGREFTIAVSKGRAYTPVERIFGEGELFSGPGGTQAERVLCARTEAPLIAECQRVALQAFDAVGGDGYGRVDLRVDDASSAVLALEVNVNCSFAPNSYFEQSVMASGSSRAIICTQLINEVM